MDPDETPVDRLAAAILAGEAVDWAALASDPSTDPEVRDLIPCLKILAGVGDVRGATAPAPLTPSWGPLRLLERIGRGSFGEVYRAWDPRLDREVALKLLWREAAGDSSGTVAIEEGRLLARVRHPNVVTVYGADRLDGRVGLWMELIRGTTLEDRLRATGPFPALEAARVGIDLCGALSAVHAAGLVHRDVKAANVIREHTGRVVLMDFGAGKDRTGAASVGDLAGTPLYVAPEVVRGEAATAASDIYGVGVLLYHLVTDRYPVSGRTAREVFEAHARDRRASLADTLSDVPPSFAAIVDAALDGRPTRRPTAADLERRLRSWVSATAAGARRPFRAPAGRAAVLAAIAAVTVAYSALAWRSSPAGGSSPAAATLEPLLVAAFDNRTGDPRLDGTVEYALERELATSPRLRIVPPERIADSLRLMKREPAGRVGPALGREVSLRDGGIGALVQGRIDKLGRGYVIGAELVEPVSGRVQVRASARASDEGGLLAAVREVSDEIRRRLGEAPAAGIDRVPLERVTTRSLKALQLYTRAVGLGHDADSSFDALRPRWLAAAELLRQALQEDPNFASAHVLRAWALKNSGSGPEAYLVHARRAMELADTVDDRERYFIRGSYHGFLGHKDEAMAAYEVLLRLDPSHYWGNGNLAFLRIAVGRHEEAVPGLVRRAELRPGSFSDNFEAAEALFLWHRDMSRAAGFARRALELRGGEDRASAAIVVGWLTLLPAYERWAAGDPEAAIAALDGVSALATTERSEEKTGLTVAEREYLIWQLAQANMAFGRIRAAEALMRAYKMPQKTSDLSALAVLHRGDVQAAQERLLRSCATRSSAQMGSSEAALAAHLGVRRCAEPVLGRYEGPESPADSVHILRRRALVLRGLLAFGSRRHEEALGLLRRGVPLNRAFGGIPFFLGTEALATLLVRAGQVGEAAIALEAADVALAFPTRPAQPAALFWMRVRLQLADVYRLQGRGRDAEDVEGDLRARLEHADPDHAIVRELKERLSPGTLRGVSP